jgi:hypothetical protein
MHAGEAPSNWLSKIISAKRGTIERLSPRQQNEAECAAIMEAIKAHPQGKPLADHPKLRDALLGALILADEMDRQAVQQPVLWAPTNIQASWLVFDKLGLPKPEPEP